MKTKNSADKCAKAIFALLAVLLLLAGCIISSSNQTYTVTFDSNEGSAVNSQTIISGNCATEPRDPTKAGYTFDGWYKNGTRFSFTTTITSDITLVAQWTENTTEVVHSTHMDIQGCSQGLKITLKNVRNAEIEVFQGNTRLPIYLWTDNSGDTYIWPFTQNGQEYTVRLRGEDTTTNQYFDNENKNCTALGGTPWSDCIALDKFMNSTIAGTFDSTTNTYKARLTNTTITNPSDVIKSTSIISNAHFSFIFVLGDDRTAGKDEWWSGNGLDTNNTSIVTGTSNGSLKQALMQYTTIPLNNWGNNNPITAEKKEEFDYTYSFLSRISFTAKSQGSNLPGDFITDEIRSVPYAYSPDIDGDDNVRVLARPQLEPLTGAEYAESGNYNKNFMRINQNQFSGGSLTLNAIKYGDGSSSNTFSVSDWDDYDSMTITVQGDEDKEIMIYALNKATGETRELTSFNIEPFEHFSATIFKEDLERFFPSTLADSNKAIAIKAHGGCTYKFTSIKFKKYTDLEDFVIFDPDTAITSFNYGNNAELVTLTDGHKYLKVTTASQITGQGVSDTVVNIPTAEVPEGYMRIKAKCFVADDKHTTTTSDTGYYTFCFLVGYQTSSNSNYYTFMQRPLFDTVTNYKSNTSANNWMRSQVETDADGMNVNRLWVWANNGKYQNDKFTKANDFADLANKEFYIGEIIAYTPTDTN